MCYGVKWIEFEVSAFGMCSAALAWSDHSFEVWLTDEASG